MGVWSDSHHLVPLLDRQFEYLRTLTGVSRVLQRRRLLEFLQQEPLLAGILEDLKHEALAAIKEQERELNDIRASVRVLWDQHKDRLRDTLANESNDALHVYGHLIHEGGYAERVSRPLVLSLDRDDDDKLAKDNVLGLQQFAAYSNAAEDKPLRASLAPLSNRADRARRELDFIRSHSPWFFFQKLWKQAESFNPPVPGDDAGTDEYVEYLVGRESTQVVFDREPQSVAARRVDDAGEREAGLREALVLRIGLQRSRLSLLQRFATRCEAFDAARLRGVAGGKQPEAKLVLELARYLFEQGIRPVIDPTISGLRPDVFDATTGLPLYVEAKQYKKDSPKADLVKAYHQVWSTWARLRERHETNEAFLVVFRRSGPLVKLPEVIQYGQQRLYSVLVDISEIGGSKETKQALSLTESVLQPSSEPLGAARRRSVVTKGRRRTRASSR